MVAVRLQISDNNGVQSQVGIGNAINH